MIKQNRMNAEHQYNLFSQVMITADRMGRHEVVLQIYYKNYNFRKWIEKEKNIVSCFIKTVAVKVKYTLHFFATVFQRSAAAIHSNYFLVADWSERQELRLWLVYSTVRYQVSNDRFLLLDQIRLMVLLSD